MNFPAFFKTAGDIIWLQCLPCHMHPKLSFSSVRMVCIFFLTQPSFPPAVISLNFALLPLQNVPGMWHWVEGKLNKAFLRFLPNFAIFDDFSNFRSAFGMLLLEKSSNMPKFGENEEKPCSTCLQLILRLIPGTIPVALCTS